MKYLQTKTGLRAAWVIAQVVLLPFGTTAVAEQSVVPVPCSVSGADFLRKCDVLTPQMQADLKKQVCTTRTGYYDGIQLQAYMPKEQQLPYGRPSCNLVRREGDTDSTQPADAATQNHKNEYCGDFDTVNVRIGGLNGNVDVSVNYGNEKTTREGSYLRGAWIQAVDFYWNEVSKEMEQTRSLKLSPSCTSLGKKLGELGTDARTISATFMKQLSGLDEKTQGDIKACKPVGEEDAWAAMPSGDSTDVGRLRQSAQYLCAARAGLETAFNQLAVCETFARAGTAYRLTFQDVDAFMKEISDRVVAPCQNQCGAVGRSCAKKCIKNIDPKKIDRCIQQCSSPVTSCANSCYRGQLRGYVKQKESPWASASSPCEAPPL